MSSFGGLATRQRMLVVTGKGGVGKSVVTAALGDALARAGQRVLLIEVDPRESLYHLLDTPPSGGDVVRATLAGQGADGDRTGTLSLQNLQPKRVIEQMVADHVRLDVLSRRVIASSVFQHFTESAPGLKEMAILVHAMRVLGHDERSDGDVDTVILDAPATGHGVSLLAAPGVVAQVIEQGPFGRVARQLVGFVSDPDRVGIVVVAAADEIPVQEAIELFDMLDQSAHREPDLLVVNGLYPALPSRVTAAAHVPLALRMLDERHRAGERALARLRASCAAPTVELPMLPIDAGPPLVTALGRRLARSLDLAADAA